VPVAEHGDVAASDGPYQVAVVEREQRTDLRPSRAAVLEVPDERREQPRSPQAVVAGAIDEG